MTGRLPLSYLLPLRTATPAPVELDDYLAGLATLVEVIVIDGSGPPVFAGHANRWSGMVRHVPVAPARRCANGKVAGVLTGLDLARHERLVVADDDVRYDGPGLARVLALLDRYDAVLPANYYDPLSWPARYDTARILLHRALGLDTGGTVAVRAALLRRTGGYAGDVLYENLELLRTVAAAGGRVHVALDLYVARRPPAARHFRGQRVRQAYDEFARPAHLVAELTVLPLLLAARHRGTWVLAAAGTAILAAELGRRRAGGAGRFPAAASLLAPAWLLERAVCGWLAVGHRLRGGVPYAGSRFRRAATPRRVLRARVAARLAESPDST